MIQIAVGHSDEVDAVDAIQDALSQCATQLKGAVPKAGILYSAIDFDHAALVARVNETYPGIDLIGCTTDGEISSAKGFAEDSVTLMLMQSDAIEIAGGVGHNLSKDAAASTREAVESAKAKMKSEPKLCIIVPEAFGPDTNAVLRGLRAALGDTFPICGGMAGDQLQFKQTFQFYGDTVASDTIPIMLFGGDLVASFGVASGWKPLGNRHRVTRSEGNTLFTIDDKPAMDLYMHYLHEHSLHYPLAVYQSEQELFYLSTPGRFNPEDGSILCQNPIPVGAEVRLAEATREQILEGARTSVQSALARYPGADPKVGLLFSCAGRRAALGTRTVEEYQGLLGLTSNVSMTGFYTYGEVCPLEPNAPTQLHNCTFVTVLLGTK